MAPFTASPVKAGSSSTKASASKAGPSFLVATRCGNGNGGGGIVYCRSRDGCQSLAERLTSKGIKARAYHAGRSLSLLQ